MTDLNTAISTMTGTVPRDVLERGYMLTLDMLVRDAEAIHARKDPHGVLGGYVATFIGAYSMLRRVTGKENPDVRYSVADAERSYLLTRLRGMGYLRQA